MIPPEALILVAIMPHPRDLEIARLLGWYRIPYRSAPKTISVDYIAFYQTANFGDDKWAINYTAQVLGHELTTRGELLRDEGDHPRADDPYYKIQLGTIEKLTEPIPSRRWRRITFFYTTGELLASAGEINDLMVGSAERELLWTALRERGLSAEKQYQPTPDVPELDLAVLCALGNLGITLDSSDDVREEELGGEWTGLYLPENKVREKPEKYAALVAEYAARLGGAIPPDKAVRRP